MAYRILRKNCNFFIEDGFSGTSEIDDMSITGGDTTLLLDEDEHDLHDAVELVPVGARFTIEDDPAVERTVISQDGSAQWQLTIGADTTGSYTLTFEGQTTASIAGTDNLAAIQAAINLLSNVEPGDLVVSGAGPYLITAAQQYANVAGLVMSGTPTDLDNFAFANVHIGGKTWSISFDPALTSGSLPSDTDLITWLPQNVEMKLGGGNFSWVEHDNVIVDLDRGVIDGMRDDDEQGMDVNANLVYEFLRSSSGAPITAYEALTRTGAAANWHNAAEDPCEPYQVTLRIVHRPPNCNSAQTEIIVIPFFKATERTIDIGEADVAFTGISAATKPTITRVSA